MITTPGGDINVPGGFTYLEGDDPGGVTIDPDSGPTTGGTVVIITGPGVGDAIDVTFGGVPGTNLIILGPDQIQVTTPPNAAGNVAVFVITADTEISVPGGFTYVDLADTGSSTTLVTLLAAILLVAGGLSVTLWVRGGTRD